MPVSGRQATKRARNKAMNHVADATALKNLASAAGEKYEATFVAALKAKNFAYKNTSRATSPIEALMIAAVTMSLGVDAFIESGRAAGDGGLQIAATMARARADMGLPPIEYHSCDWSKARTHRAEDDKAAIAKLSGIRNVTFHDGNALLMVPRLVRQLGEAGKRTVVYVDGPKGYASMVLLHDLIRIPSVAALIESDASYGYDARGHLENLVSHGSSDMNRDHWPCKTTTFATDDPSWVARYAHYNADFCADKACVKYLTEGYKTRPPCCKYAAPKPCWGDVTLNAAAVLIMRTHPASQCSVGPKEKLTPPKCMTANGASTKDRSCSPKAWTCRPIE
jgi:hypothetical protein